MKIAQVVSVAVGIAGGVWASPITDISAAGMNVLANRQSASYLRNCSPEQSKLVQIALGEMQEMASAAAGAVKSSNKYYTAFFGAQPNGGNTDARIQSQYKKLSTWLNTQSKEMYFNCKFEGEPVCSQRSSIHAWTTKGGAQITLCRSFFTMPNLFIRKLVPPSIHRYSVSLDEYTTMAYILLHEMTHAWFSTEDAKIKNGQIAYGHSNTMQLAAENPTAARTNADNYAYFAVASYLLGKHYTWFSTDPAKLQQAPNQDF